MSTTFYFRDASFNYPGTMPSGEQSSSSPSWSASGATTLRTLSYQKGGSVTSLSGNSSATIFKQRGFMGMFATPPLRGAHTIGAGDLTFNCADQEDSDAMNFWVNALNVYVWRPSTGTKVGTLIDSAGTSLGGTEGSYKYPTVTYITGINLSNVSASDGDIIIIEVWSVFTQNMSTSYNAKFWYDGVNIVTTEDQRSDDHASYVIFDDNINVHRKIISVS